MTTVFVSHSKRDEKIKNFFALIFNRKGIKSILMELEDLQYMNKGVEISRKIREESDALVVLLGKNVQSPPKRAHNFTRNWVSFEVGVAAGCKKPVWVFEDLRTPVDFPIPYVTDYFKYRLNDGSDIRKISDLLESRLIDKPADTDHHVEFICKVCRSSYNYWSSPKTVNCPVCRGESKFESETGNWHTRQKSALDLPKVSMIYKNKSYRIEPYLYTKRKKMVVVGDPGDPHHGDPVDLTLMASEIIQFNFKQKPLSVNAFLVDYDGYPQSFTYIPKVGDYKFKLEYPFEIPNHNLHVFVEYPHRFDIIYNKYVDVRLKKGIKEKYYEPYDIEIVGTRASKETMLNHSSFVIDHNRDNFWSGRGKNSSIEAELGKMHSVKSFDVTWLEGERRLIHFDVSFSNDGKSFSNNIRFVSVGVQTTETFIISHSPLSGPRARYVRLTFHHNTQDDYVSVTGLTIQGHRLKH